MAVKGAAFWLCIAAINGAMGIGAAAFGTHGLANQVPAIDLAAFRTGAEYQIYHAIALLALGGWLHGENAPVAAFRLCGWLFLAGIVLFSGSLYFLGLSGSRALVWLTPIGGLAFLGGWLTLVYAAWQIRQH